MGAGGSPGLCTTRYPVGRGGLFQTVSEFRGRKNQNNIISENLESFPTVNFHNSSHLGSMYLILDATGVVLYRQVVREES